MYKRQDVEWHGKVPFVVLLAILLVFVIVATEPSLVLFLVFMLYALAGPINTFRSVDKVTLEHVIGDAEEHDAAFPQPGTDKSEVKSNTSSNPPH